MTEDAAFPPGTVLAGRYQVRRELGRGGMGMVYLCRDLALDERVALKLFGKPGETTRPEDAWWFQEEARALAGLNHPAIVRARDFGALPDGTPYLVMDAAPGRSLHEWIYLAQHDGLLPWPVIWSCTKMSAQFSVAMPSRSLSQVSLVSPGTRLLAVLANPT